MAEKVLSILAIMQGGFFFALLFYSAYTDLKRRKIYNIPCLWALMIGLFLSYIRGGVGSAWPHSGVSVSLLGSLAGAGVAFAIFFLAYLVGGLGDGDVKLMAAIGALTNLKFVLWVTIFASMAGVPLALGAMILRGDLKSGLRRTMRGMWRLRYRPPEPIESTGTSTASPAPNDNEEGASKAVAPEKATSIPYAIAIVAGALFTLWRMAVTSPESLPF